MVGSARDALFGPPLPEEFPERETAGILGSAIGAILRALTGNTLVVVDAGLWPRRGAATKTLEALVHALAGPGAVVIAACEPTDLYADPPERRTLLLEPLDRESVHELVKRWGSLLPAKPWPGGSRE